MYLRLNELIPSCVKPLLEDLLTNITKIGVNLVASHALVLSAPEHLKLQEWLILCISPINWNKHRNRYMKSTHWGAMYGRLSCHPVVPYQHVHYLISPSWPLPPSHHPRASGNMDKHTQDPQQIWMLLQNIHAPWNFEFPKWFTATCGRPQTHFCTSTTGELNTYKTIWNDTELKVESPYNIWGGPIY